MSRFLTIAGALCLLANANPAHSQVLSAKLEKTFAGNEEGRYVAFSPDSRMVAQSNIGPRVFIWSVPDGKLLATLNHPTGVPVVVFSPDGQSLATSGYDALIRIWNIRDGKVVRTLKGSVGTVWTLAYSPDGTMLASGGEDKLVRLWRVSDGSLLRTLKGHTMNVWSVNFSPDGQLLASGSFDKTAKVWSVNTGRLTRTLAGHTQAVVHLAFSPVGFLATGGDDNTVKFWNVQNGRMITSITVGNHVYSLDFSADGRWLVTGGRGRSAVATFWHQLVGERYTPGSNKGLKLWRVRDGALMETVLGHTNDVWSASLSRDGKWLASSSEDGSLKLWSLSVR